MSWVSFGDVSHKLCGMQSQYCSHFIDGRHESPRLSDGLRFRRRSTGGVVDAKDYHDVEVHADDADEFARRVNDYRRSIRAIP